MKKKARISIRTKLLASSLLLLVIMVVVGLVGYLAIQRLQASVADIARKTLLAQGAQQVQVLVNREAMQAQSFMLTQNEQDATDYKATSSQLAKQLDGLITTATSSTTRDQFKSIKALESDDFNAIQEIFANARSGQRDQALMTFQQTAMPRIVTMAGTASDIAGGINQRTGDTVTQGNTQANQSLQLMLGTVLAALLIGIIAAMLLARALSAPIRRLAEVASRVADGDLTVAAVRITSRDELGEVAATFNQMVENLRTLVRQVTSGSGQVATAADDLATITGQVSESSVEVTQAVGGVAQGASDQSRSAHEASRVVEELRTAITQIAAGAQDQARNAQDSAELVAEMADAIAEADAALGTAIETSRQATVAAQSGGDVIQRSSEGMSRIHNAVVATAGQIRELGRTSSQISEITTTITEIADQTNLLALNAAIEAARAGDHGRGFAVVADEVRKLAERAARSSQEIASLITSVRLSTTQAVQNMEAVTAEVEEGSKLSVETRSSLEEIQRMVAETGDRVDTVIAVSTRLTTVSGQVMQAVNAVASVTEENTAATEEMAAGADQVTEAIHAIAAVSEENASSSEEVSAAMEELSAGADSIANSAGSLSRVAAELQSQVARFRV
ncbi:MAG: methyl-accepting chemotaxis protein [Firmicutes bacterium]|nr:methyl-accepting chemotaxis protein [Bacillota bacterium]